MNPEKIDLTAATISEEKLAQLRDLLPEVFHEGKIDFDELRTALGDYVDEDPRNERFGLRWPGKSRLQQVINTPSVGTLVPQPEESVDWDTTGNVIIEGDNLEVLKLLQKSYAGKVKMIYIDPPYNTGNDFVYPDKYVSGMDTYLELTGQKDGEGNRLTTNSDTSGRYHANWLNMMYPRLYLARNLLRQDGLVAISIDDNELVHLRGLVSEVFGADNHVATISLKNKAGAGAKPRWFISVHEYIVVFCRDSSALGSISEPLRDSQISLYRLRDEHYETRGPYGTWALATTSMGERPNLRYPILHNGEEIWPEKQWLWSRERVEAAQESDELVFNRMKDGRWSVRFKRYLRDDQGNVGTGTPTTHWDGPYTHTGTKELDELFPKGVFDFPKPTGIVARLLSFETSGGKDASHANSDEIILDFFAGSGTTGHAVMQQNAGDSGNRKFILVQLPEPMEPKTLDDGTELRTIADVCRERVRRAGRKVTSDHPDASIDTGFRAYKLAPSNFTPWDGTPENGGLLTSARQASFMPQTQQLTLEQRILQAADHLHPQASDTAILTELLLKLGEELTVPVRELTLAGKTVYNVDNNLRLVCLDRHLTLDVIREMAAREPGEIICLDAGFPDDGTKVNAGQIIATQARHAESAIQFKVV